MVEFGCLMRWLILLAFGVAASLALPVPAKKKPAPTKAVKRSSSVRRASRSRTRSRKASVPSYQLHPDPERYTQIQKALAERGYFKGEANGEWKDDSVDALRRFQTDQKLPDDGKISALSLTALGLGPRHDGTTASTVPTTPPADEPTLSPPNL